jgi:replicative DNA helicase
MAFFLAWGLFMHDPKSMTSTDSRNNYFPHTIHDSNKIQCALESEKALVRVALDSANDASFRELSKGLGSDDFFVPAHQNIWRTRMQLADAGVAHDITALLDATRKMGLDVGGADYALGLLHDDVLGAIGDLALTAAAQRVKNLSQLRSFTQTLRSALALAESGAHGYDDILQYVADTIEAARSDAALKNTGPTHLMNFVAAVTEQVQMRMEGQAPNNITPTGFAGLDKLLGGGLGDGDLIYLAARPSMGKTALSLAISEGMSNKRHILYFSTEQSGNALTYRILASKSRVDASRIKTGEFRPGDFDRFADSLDSASRMPIYIDETSEISLPEIKSRARTFAQKMNHEPMVIVVDYIQRLKPHREADPRHVIGEISTGLKNLAKELKCPVLALAQLNRELEKRANKRPMMSDLAESGKLEQDADIALFLYRDEIYNPDSKSPGITEAIVGKNRDGAVGVAKLEFNSNTQRFTDLSTSDPFA